MRIRTVPVAALAGGVLALAVAAPALATDDGGGAKPARTTLSAGWQPPTVEAGGTATLSWTLGQPRDQVADGTVTISHPRGLRFVSTGDGSADCTDSGTLLTCGYTDMAHTYKSDHAVFAVDRRFAREFGSRVRVELAGCNRSVTAWAKLTVTAPASESPSPSDSPSGSPSEEPTGTPSESPSEQPGSPSTSPSASGTATQSPTAQPSLTVVGAGGSGSLPVTGTPLGLVAGGAAALLAGGTALLVLARKRRTRP